MIPAQREALSAIFSFQQGGAFAPQAGLVFEVLGVKFVPITFEAQGRQWKMAIAGIGDADITAIDGLDGKEIRIENLPRRPFPFVAAKSNHTAYKDFDLQCGDQQQEWVLLAVRLQIRLILLPIALCL